MRRGNVIIDDSINAKLDYFIQDNGVRWYLISDVPDDEPEKALHQSLMTQIARKYRKLAVIELTGKIINSQREFDRIRPLLNFVEDQP
jgi:hypothetical protein